MERIRMGYWSAGVLENKTTDHGQGTESDEIPNHQFSGVEQNPLPPMATGKLWNHANDFRRLPA
jgi:hypothetical protein